MNTILLSYMLSFIHSVVRKRYSCVLNRFDKNVTFCICAMNNKFNHFLRNARFGITQVC